MKESKREQKEETWTYAQTSVTLAVEYHQDSLASLDVLPANEPYTQRQMHPG